MGSFGFRYGNIEKSLPVGFHGDFWRRDDASFITQEPFFRNLLAGGVICVLLSLI